MPSACRRSPRFCETTPGTAVGEPDYLDRAGRAGAEGVLGIGGAEGAQKSFEQSIANRNHGVSRKPHPRGAKLFPESFPAELERTALVDHDDVNVVADVPAAALPPRELLAGTGERPGVEPVATRRGCGSGGPPGEGPLLAAREKPKPVRFALRLVGVHVQRNHAGNGPPRIAVGLKQLENSGGLSAADGACYDDPSARRFRWRWHGSILTCPGHEHQDAYMRTTLTLDEDVAARVRELSRLTQRSFKETVNDVLRAGLNTPAHTGDSPFTVVPHDTGLKPGVDPRRLNQLLDELEARDAAAETSREYGTHAGQTQ